MSQQSQKKTQSQAQDALKPAEDAVSAGKRQVEAVVKASNEAATKHYEQVVGLAKDQAEKTSKAMFRGYDEVNALNKANVDAVVEASTVLAKGIESMGRELISFAQSSMETNVATTKALFGAKTLSEIFDLQADYARKQLDTMLAESAKVTEMSVKVTNDALAPLQARTNASVEKLFKPAA